MILRNTTMSKRKALSASFKPSKIDHLEIAPLTFTQANPHKEWRIAMSEEITTVLNTNTWTLVPRPHGKNIIKCKWVHRIKQNAKGKKIIKCKWVHIIKCNQM